MLSRVTAKNIGDVFLRVQILTGAEVNTETRKNYALKLCNVDVLLYHGKQQKYAVE